RRGHAGARHLAAPLARRRLNPRPSEGIHMKTRHHAIALSAALFCLLAAGCSPDADGGSGTTADTGAGTFIGRKAAQAMDAAGERLKTENIRLDGGFQVNVGGQEFGTPKDKNLPRAE